jgi:hypothetical protein
MKSLKLLVLKHINKDETCENIIKWVKTTGLFDEKKWDEFMKFTLWIMYVFSDLQFFF